MEGAIRYAPEFFDAADIEAAKAIILTEEDTSTADRWERETAWTVDLLLKRWDIGPETLVLDYGCGVGRLAKALIERTGCMVFGVDISQRMCSLALDYVDSNRFVVYPPRALRRVRPLADYAIATWVLQHTFDPGEDIETIHDAMSGYGELFVLNSRNRIVPVEGGCFARDGKSVPEILARFFDPLTPPRTIPLEASSPDVHGDSWWRFYRRR
jgi:SAM-dependent methyltransferase